MHSFKDPPWRLEGRPRATFWGPGRKSLGLWEAADSSGGVGGGGGGGEGWSVGIKHGDVKGHGIWKVCPRKVTLAAVREWVVVPEAGGRDHFRPNEPVNGGGRSQTGLALGSGLVTMSRTRQGQRGCTDKNCEKPSWCGAQNLLSPAELPGPSP